MNSTDLPAIGNGSFQASWLFHRGTWSQIADPLPDGIDDEQLKAIGYVRSHCADALFSFVEIYRRGNSKAPHDFLVRFSDLDMPWADVYCSDFPSLLQLLHLAGPLLVLDQMLADAFVRESLACDRAKSRRLSA